MFQKSSHVEIVSVLVIRASVNGTDKKNAPREMKLKTWKQYCEICTKINCSSWK